VSAVDPLPTPPRYAEPPPPTPTDVDSMARWRAMADKSLAATQAAADKWRTGLAAFVTLVTGGLIIKGPSAANDITVGWRLALTLLVGGGLAAAIAGLWQALRAAAGAPSVVDYTQIVERYGGMRQFEAACAAKAAQGLRWAKGLVATSLILLGAAVITWWWAPPQPAPATGDVQVQVFGRVICGTLLGGDHHGLEIQVSGDSTPVRVPLAATQNLQIVSSCP
jgi:hypothetical protein